MGQRRFRWMWTLAMFVPAFAAAQSTDRLYSLSPTGWQRNTTPYGEVFTCSVCEAQIQVQIDVGPLLGPDAKFRTNEQFLAQLKTPEQQKKFADSLLRSQIPLQSGYSIEMQRVGLTKSVAVRHFNLWPLWTWGARPPVEKPQCSSSIRSAS